MPTIDNQHDKTTPTPAEISAQLGCAPGAVRGALGNLREQGAVTRPRDGVYTLPQPGVERPAPERPSSLRRASVATPAVEVTPAQREAVLSLLRAHGRPMSRTLLITRLSGQRITLAVLEAALEELHAAGQAQQTAERLWEAC